MPIVLLKYFTWVGDNGSSMNTEFVEFPAEHVNAQLTILCKSLIAGSAVTVQLQSSWDTDAVTNVGAPQLVNAVGTTILNVTAGLGPMLRLNLSSTAPSQLIVSVFLTPKSA